MNVTPEANCGYTAARTGSTCNDFLYSSPCWYAYELGAHMAKSGMSAPRNVRTGRGSKMHANDMQFKHLAGQNKWERIA